MDSDSTVDKISSIVGDSSLATDIKYSIESALNYHGFKSMTGHTVWSVFSDSLNAAIRDIEIDPRGKLFRRLIEFGFLDPDKPIALKSDNKTSLSDPECAACVEFIYSHMVNRFKGELAELLGLQPCIELIANLESKNQLPENISLFWGEQIKEHRRLKYDKGSNTEIWGSFSKGADGLIAQKLSVNKIHQAHKLKIFGIVEIKSMKRSLNTVNKQIENHLNRLKGGIMLGEEEWTTEKLIFPSKIFKSEAREDILRIMIIPSTWKLSRKWVFKENGSKRELIPPPLDIPPESTKIEEHYSNVWKITLNWSEEALHQAAYEMTYWYMSKVGLSIYKNKPLPKGWEGMTPEQAGYNAIKMMLYYIPLRYLSKRQESKAIKLYNIYSFGFPLGTDSKVMLWPEDVEKMISNLLCKS